MRGGRLAPTPSNLHRLPGAGGEPATAPERPQAAVTSTMSAWEGAPA